MQEIAKDYKGTLKLPKTSFPMRANLPVREPRLLDRWEEIGIYDRLREKIGRKPYILHDGPPYANGHLHIGHALNKILKDLVVRSHQMMGFDARYVPGWDCHGLPIEWKIEENYRSRGMNKDDVSIVDLRRDCRKFAEKWIDIQREEFMRLGVIGKWFDPYLTMDYQAEATIAEEFMKFLMNGVLYQGSKPVMWSVVEKTALAEAEVEYHDHVSQAVWVKFPVANVGAAESDVVSLLTGSSVLIWSTTPWTIPSNRAICYNPDLAYALYEVDDAPPDNRVRAGERHLLATRVADDVMEAMRVKSFRKIADMSGQRIGQITCAHPFRGMVNPEAAGENDRWDYGVPLLEGDHVTDDAGTGLVHTAPSHGEDDYLIGMRFGLKITHNVGEDGAFRQELPFFGGTRIFTEKGKEGDANKAVINKLRDAGLLAATRRVTHSYPHSWRSKAPLIFRNTKQWFAAIDEPVDDGQTRLGDTIRKRALTSIADHVKWTPVTGRNRLYSMMKDRPDWVLSRQRAWGVPLTCFVKKGADSDADDFLLRDETVNARIVEAFRSDGAEAWYEEGAKERFLGDDYDPGEYEQVFDILDVWFDSGSTHAFVLRDRQDGAEDGIADLYLEGTDQHRGWFHSSLLQACGTIGTAPYKGVLTHGFVLDSNGYKMSKSLGNIVAPEKVIKQKGADILRLWVAQSDYTADLRIGQEILKGVSDSYRRLRNTFRFLLGNLQDFGEAERVDPVDMPELERWVLHRLAELDTVVRTGYAEFDFQGVFQSLFNFATTDLSSFYFDIRKDVLYCDAESGMARRACRTVLDILFYRLTTWLAPILVFTMEEVWLQRFDGDGDSIHLVDFPDTPHSWKDDELASRWEVMRTARRAVTAALELQRQAKVIGASLEAAPLVQVADADLHDILNSLDFADICITSSIELALSPIADDAYRPSGAENIGVIFKRATGEKCRRCWKILPEVAQSDAVLCQRCASMVA